jgi:hypothetical protein
MFVVIKQELMDERFNFYPVLIKATTYLLKLLIGI